MVVTHQLVVDAAGPEGTVRVAVGFSHDPSDARTDYLRSKVVRAYQDVFETDVEPNVTFATEPAPALAS